MLLQLFQWGATFCLIPLKWARLAFASGNHDDREVSMKLPSPLTEGSLSLEQAIHRRRTVRSFTPQALELGQLSQLLWAAGGITEPGGFKRAAPSAGALYPMDVYTVVGRDAVARLGAGVYHYKPIGHQLSLVAEGDLRGAVCEAALHQNWMASAPISVAITAEYPRVTKKYGKRGVRYAMIEAGHIAQNLFLQAEALGLAAGIVGAFHDSRLIEALNIPATREPLLVMPIGHRG